MDEGETLGDTIDRLHYSNAEKAKRIAELEAQVDSLTEEVAAAWSTHDLVKERLRELWAQWPEVDEKTVDQWEADMSAALDA